MSNQPIDPEEIVSDGAEQGRKPVPRDGGDANGTGTAPGISGDPASSVPASKGGADGGAAGTGDTNKVPGPAEEQDEKTADSRGLTTDTSPD